MNKKTPSSDLLKRYLANDCTAGEREMVDGWYKTLHLTSDEKFTEEDQELLFNRIENQISEIQPALHSKRNTFNNWWVYASGIAAMLLLSIGFLYYTSKIDSKHEITTGEHPVLITNRQKKALKYELPDHSIIWLQPEASIEHPKTFDSKTREISFSGEAFFDITKNPDQPFVIKSGKLKTVVHGTSFNIRANRNDSNYQVSVVTGSVSVSASDGGKDTGTVLLKPQQQAIFSTATNDLTLNTIKNKQTDIEPWQPVSLTFDDTRLGDIVARLQKTFRVKISLSNPAMMDCVLKVDFNNQNLPEILEMLNTLMVSTYEIEGQHIIMSGQGCGAN
ncbi:FecR family protein [Dyadobacter sp. CY312]|uniref:FecR family protein n=1 Tax=Dyadobacter sp. CY312 TaxID=2907303 RepID=UPI001F1F7160|nr:FecR family protein [Dyadobacter sp. CY312]MCE7039563.1 FecR family protein [Dyadobacter sp. CY312]